MAQSPEEAAQDRALAEQRKLLCRYINDTNQFPLPVHEFDDDWTPAGDMYREDLIEAGLIEIREPGEEEPGGIYLTPAGAEMVDG